MTQRVSLVVNGRRREEAIEDELLLLDYLRERRGLTGTKRGCDGGECGACTVLIDGEPRLACLTLAASCAGSRGRDDRIAEFQGNVERVAACLPREAGHAMRLLHARHDHGGGGAAAPESAAGEAEIREALGGNLCRCTGYVKIIEAVQEAAR